MADIRLFALRFPSEQRTILLRIMPGWRSVAGVLRAAEAALDGQLVNVAVDHWAPTGSMPLLQAVEAVLHRYRRWTRPVGGASRQVPLDITLEVCVL
jgi:hypothetical protein